MNAENSTWGRHLLRGISPGQRPAELQKLRAAFQRVVTRAVLAPYK